MGYPQSQLLLHTLRNSPPSPTQLKRFRPSKRYRRIHRRIAQADAPLQAAINLNEMTRVLDAKQQLIIEGGALPPPAKRILNSPSPKPPSRTDQPTATAPLNALPTQFFAYNNGAELDKQWPSVGPSVHYDSDGDLSPRELRNATYRQALNNPNLTILRDPNGTETTLFARVSNMTHQQALNTTFDLRTLIADWNAFIRDLADPSIPVDDIVLQLYCNMIKTGICVFKRASNHPLPQKLHSHRTMPIPTHNLNHQRLQSLRSGYIRHGHS